MLITPFLASVPRPATAPAACVTFCDHWSYTGIGWQLGVESDALSLNDAMNLYDACGGKTCIDFDTRAYEKLQEAYPEVLARFRKYLSDRRLEVTGGTYGQPMGSMFSGESDIRQVAFGVADLKRLLGYRPTTFLNEEDFTFPQLPQILRSAGYRYASLAQLDTWGRAGCPPMQIDAFDWEGTDGTKIPSTPENSLFRAPLDPGDEAKNWDSTVASTDFKALQRQGVPLYIGWEEFGWERPETPAYTWLAPACEALTKKANVRYVTLTEYMRRYVSGGLATRRLKMDDWNKVLTWGLGGDQLRIYGNQVEDRLSAAERFDAVAAELGRPSSAAALTLAWKDRLASESHDAGLCEYSRWQGDRMAALDRVEDHHDQTWGSLGYNLLDSANSVAGRVLDSSLRFIASRTNTRHLGGRVCTVFNACAWARDGIVVTEKLYPLPAGSKAVVARDAAGRIVPSQILEGERDAGGNLVACKVEFAAKGVPGVGYSAYSLSFSPSLTPAHSDLKTDRSAFTLENAYLKVRLDPTTGAIASLIDKRTGHESLRPGSSYPVFRGQPDPGYPLRGNIPADYDSSKAKAELTWTEDGPVRSTLRARFHFSNLDFETDISLACGEPRVEVVSRVLSAVPPRRDDDPKNIQRGWYLDLMPSEKPREVVRDCPLDVEDATRATFHALNFADLVNGDGGLLVIHPGTEYFRFEPDGTLANLIEREWESYYSGEWGWTRYAEYHHELQPHGADFSNADRIRAAADANDPLIAVMGPAHSGRLGPSLGQVSVSSSAMELSELREKPGGGIEVRVVNTTGRALKGTVSFGFLVKSARKTNILGEDAGPLPISRHAVSVSLGPWKFQTIALSPR